MATPIFLPAQQMYDINSSYQFKRESQGMKLPPRSQKPKRSVLAQGMNRSID
jgi:hypothetical protein